MDGWGQRSDWPDHLVSLLPAHSRSLMPQSTRAEDKWTPGGLVSSPWIHGYIRLGVTSWYKLIFLETPKSNLTIFIPL